MLSTYLPSRYRTPTNTKKPTTTTSSTASKYLSKYDDAIESDNLKKYESSYYSGGDSAASQNKSGLKKPSTYLSTKTEPLLDLIKSLELTEEKSSPTLNSKSTPNKYSNDHDKIMLDDDPTTNEINAVLSQAEENYGSHNLVQTTNMPAPTSVSTQAQMPTTSGGSNDFVEEFINDYINNTLLKSDLNNNTNNQSNHNIMEVSNSIPEKTMLPENYQIENKVIVPTTPTNSNTTQHETMLSKHGGINLNSNGIGNTYSLNENINNLTETSKLDKLDNNSNIGNSIVSNGINSMSHSNINNIGNNNTSNNINNTNNTNNNTSNHHTISNNTLSNQNSYNSDFGIFNSSDNSWLVRFYFGFLVFCLRFGKCLIYQKMNDGI